MTSRSKGHQATYEVSDVIIEWPQGQRVIKRPMK